jgi:soluble lytic murein transglycosylase
LPLSSHSAHIAVKRAEALKEIGLYDYAVEELLRFRGASIKEDVERCWYLQFYGAYRDSFKCIAGVKGSRIPLKFFYPLAYSEIIGKVSEKYYVDPFIILSVIREESRFDEEALSPAGALGLMQLMPFTAKRMAERTGVDPTGIESDEDIMLPLQNITLGTSYLKQLLEEFRSVPLAVAAYNAGDDPVRRWLKARPYLEVDEFIEDIPYDETRRYVKRVMRSYFMYKRIYRREWSIKTSSLH